MKFNPSKVAFGRHETFGLRYSWLPKGFQTLMQRPALFDSDDAVVELGVGKNMVNSIRYWLRACQLITPQKPDEALSIGDLIFSEDKGLDPYLEDEATIWLMHWLLATNAPQATSWFWFFNKFHKPEFTSRELQTALGDFVNDQVDQNKRPSMGTLKNDATLLPRMYCQSPGNTRSPLEESLDSPMALLGLVSQSTSGRSFRSKPEPRPNLPVGVFAFAVTQLVEAKNVTTMPIEELMYSRDDYASPGSVFRLTESDLITKLELMIDYLPGHFEIRDTAGLHQIFQLKEIHPEAYLHKHYLEMQAGIAA